MAMKPYQEKIIQLYETQERQLAELYSAFSDRFEADRVFWRELAAEEAKHAVIVAKLYSAVEKGGVLFDEGKVKTYTLAKMIEHTEALLDLSRRGAMDRIVALSQAVDLESSLIEKGVFSHFEALTDKAQAVLKRLNGETLDHIAGDLIVFKSLCADAQQALETVRHCRRTIEAAGSLNAASG